MRGGVQLTIALVAGFVSLCYGRCYREPGSTAPRSPSDGRFFIKISDNSDMYVPGTPYTVSLEGRVTLHSASKYIGFTLVAEPEIPDYSGSNAENKNVGVFELTGDAFTKYSDRCPNAVTHANTLPKSEIKVIWIAPQSGSGCVLIKATVIEHRDIWFMDDGALTKRLCEDVQRSQDSQPDIVDPCCACNEAKYEVTFEGLWSRHTHPKDFPSNGWLTRFSDVIGASHTVDYRFWDYGVMASEGLRQVAENGATRMLESELKSQSEHIRTIIKARGISFPNVTGKTFAVFRVDRRHHLVSLVSMIDPSPDWFVGVSGLELCLENCQWVESKVLNLYPYDAGTDSGTTYISPNQPTTPREVVKRIRSTYPHDDRSPFFDANGNEIKPLAKLYLSRQRLYEKTCDDGSNEETSEDTGENTGPCAVGEWTEFTSCSTTCGKGSKYRQRFYMNQEQSDKMKCKRKLTERVYCRSLLECPKVPWESEELINDPKCALTEWSEWSSCSSRCGNGTRTRSRRYAHKNAMKHCTTVKSPPRLEHNDECQGTETDCKDEEVYEKEGCEMTQWTYWSSCSAICGKGFKRRIRWPMNLDYSSSEHGNVDEVEDYSTENPCSNVKTVEEVECEDEKPPCDVDPTQAKAICKAPKDSGPCQSYIEKWYYNSDSENCEMFQYGGCQGNRNNFDTKENCEHVCKTSEATNAPFGPLKPGNSILDTSMFNPGINTGDGSHTDDASQFNNTIHILEETSGPVVNCMVSRWSSWSPCNTSCGRGMREKSRYIKVYPTNGGKACPPKLIKRRVCGRKSCTESENSQNQNTHHHPLTPTWGPGPNHPGSVKVDCVLSEWSSWSPCNASCGPDAIKIRTRSVIRQRKGRGRHCLERTQMLNCELLPCPI